MTFAQLQAFTAVARLGSVKAAARALGVSEPAVSAAVSALRRDFGDELFRRDGRGVTLTPGGTRLASAASEILGLAERARRSVGESAGATPLLNVSVTNAVSELVASPLLDAFTRRVQNVELNLQVAPGPAFADLLEDRLADVTLGPGVGGSAAVGIESVPFLRYRMVIVAAPGHRLARRRDIAPAELAGERWLVGPSGAGPETAVGGFLGRRRLAPDEVIAFSTYAAAAAAAAGGHGVTLAIAHTVLDDLRRGTLARLDVRGTPLERLWHASALRADRRPPAAAALLRFVTSPDATQAILARRGGVPAGRFRSP
ncbi:MAG: LysR family transcriptional regulator, partial [Thermoleophilaceae bacterium]|nr:LysR family transcriptional regulator [Thermoleophilaceae bacterium]